VASCVRRRVEPARLWIAGARLVAPLLVAVLAPRASADELDAIRARGELVHCGDAEGSAPYAYPDPTDPGRLIGLDQELATIFGDALGVRTRFQQGLWETLPELLRTGRCDVILNGFEWRRDRVAEMEATIPYFVYGLTLLTRADDTRLAGPDALAAPPAGEPLRVGVLGGSAAEQWLEAHASAALARGALDLVRYDGNTNAMREVETQKLDATLQDTPIAAFYARRFPTLTRRGDVVGRGYYVAYVRRGEARLVAALDAALAGAIRDGRWPAALVRHGVDDALQAELPEIVAHVALKDRALAASQVPGPGAGTRGASTATTAGAARGLTADATPARAGASLAAYAWLLVESAGMTLLLSITSFPLAVALGILLALVHGYGPRPARLLVRAYVELVRGTPLMLQLYFVFFFLPELGIRVPALATAILGLALNYGAYESEIYRAGLSAVPAGQLEAAVALGMRPLQALRRVVVPQALRTSLPPMVNDFIALFKDTSVCSVVTVVELTKEFSVVSQSSGRILELMAVTGLLYLLMSLPAAGFARRLERKLETGR
jgi:polar amino acid transport system substrate-binding protein